MTSPTTPDAGSALAGRYVLEARIGTGGAGVVWRARDDLLGRHVAVKLLHPEIARDPASAARFRTEATAAARLTHPNAVVVFDIGRDGDRDYLVMELVDGPDLTQLLGHRSLAPAVVAHLGRAVAAALGAAHGRGLVHRDVKPGNVLLTRDGVPKVADFGIARAMDDAMARLTRPGSVMGTARYVAPEQLEDGSVDARADVYALGLVLHESLTGEPPWGQGTATEVAMRRLATDLPPVSSVRSDVPPGLDAVIARATRRDPDDRPADGSEFAAALTPFTTADAPAVLASLVDEVFPRPAGSLTPRGPGHTPSHSSAPARLPSRPAPTLAAPASTASQATGTRALAPTTSVAPPPPPPPRRRRRRTWVVGGLTAAVAATVGVLGMLDGALPTTTARPTSDVEVAAAGDHDPLGDQRERRDRLDQAIDGDDDTWWQTETYERADLIPPRKDGVGIWFDLGQPHDVRRIDLDLVTDGSSFEVWVGDEAPAAGVRPDDWGTRVAEIRGAGRSERVEPDGVRGTVWLVWFTQLPPADDGFRAHVADVRFRAR